MTEAQSAPVTAEGRLEEVKAFFNQGEFFRAYDLAAEALELFPGNAGLAHRAVLSLANAGATALALERYTNSVSISDSLIGWRLTSAACSPG
ncbi:hypothetical protein [Mycobacterium sp.]|uniref:hypothetical protein n=1 Tax=Mycobacterium sp. TaxID=1785 RepID=UPI003BB593E0